MVDLNSDAVEVAAEVLRASGARCGEGSSEVGAQHAETSDMTPVARVADS